MAGQEESIQSYWFLIIYNKYTDQDRLGYIGSTAACCAGKEGLIYAKMN